MSSINLPNLVELKLHNCRIGSKAELLQLVTTSGLTSLHLEELSWTEGARGRTAWTVPLCTVVPALEHCSKLVTLRLKLPSGMGDFGRTSSSPLAGISRLQHLQHLSLDLPYDAPEHFFPEVPAGLTHLELKSGNSGVGGVKPAVLRQIPQLQHLQSLSIKRMPRFDAGTLVGMTQLVCLRLKDVPVDAASLGSMPHLQELVLDKCHTAAPIVSGNDNQRRDDHYYYGRGYGHNHNDDHGVATSAMAAIGQLTALKVLKIVEWAGPDRYDSLLHKAPPDSYSALTASSQLQCLHVDCMGEDPYSSRSSIPDGAVGHMFPPGRLLQHLVFLQIGSDNPNFHHRRCAYDDDGENVSDGSLSGEELQRIVCSCPSLQSLHLKGSLKADQAVDALLQLSECCSLSIGGSDYEWSNAAAAVVAQMTQLTHLSCLCSRGFNGLGLQLLTALTNLQRLEIKAMFCDGYSDRQDCVMEKDLQVTLDMEHRRLLVLESQV
jgi:hypothetical protein